MSYFNWAMLIFVGSLIPEILTEFAFWNLNPRFWVEITRSMTGY